MKPKYLSIEYVDIANGIQYNDKECDFENNVFPFSKRSGNPDYDANINFVIDIDEGKILHWRKGNTAFICNRPINSGIYTFLDENNKVIFNISDYVPDGLDIEEEGDGNYIIMKVLPNGMINNWNKNLILNLFEKCNSYVNL